MLHQDKESTDEGQRLSERQREVLQLLTEGKSMKEAAYILNVTTSTVAFHKLRITKVLNAGSNTDLVQYAVRNHLIVGGSQAEITRPSNVHAKQHGEGQVFA